MIKVQVAHEFVVTYKDGTRLTTADLHAQGEQLMEALLNLEMCNDDISGSATASNGIEGTITAELMVTAETEDAAFKQSMIIVRTAIHGIGGSTRGWESSKPDAKYQARSSQLEYV